MSGKNQKPYILISIGGSLLSYTSLNTILNIFSQQDSLHIRCIRPYFENQDFLSVYEKFSSDTHIEFLPFSSDVRSLIGQAEMYIC